MISTGDTYWQCPECGQIVSDLKKRSFVCDMPCLGCNGTTAEYQPRASMREVKETDQVYLRGIRAVLAQAASGFIVPTAVPVASPAPFEEALQRLPAQMDEGFDMAIWIERMALQLGAITDYPDFRRKLFAAAALLRSQGDDLAHFNAWAQGLAPVPVADRPWEQPGWCDAEGRCWMGRRRIGGDPGPCLAPHWVFSKPSNSHTHTHSLPHWAIPAVPTKSTEVQP